MILMAYLGLSMTTTRLKAVSLRSLGSQQMQSVGSVVRPQSVTAAEPTTKTKETVPCRIPSTNASASTPYVNIDSSSDVTKTQMAHTINRNRSGLSQTRRVPEVTAAASVIFPSAIMCALECPCLTTARLQQQK